MAQGVLVYVAVDQVDRTDLAGSARLAPDLGSESGPPLRLDATPTPTATVPVPGVESSVRVAERPAVPVPGEVELIFAEAPPGPAPGGPAGEADGSDVATPVQRPRPRALAPAGDETDTDAPTTRFPTFPTRLSNPDRDDSGDQREDLESSEPSHSPPSRGGGEDERVGERRGPNTCDDERVDHHDHGDDHGVDCETPQRDRARTSPGATAEEAPPAHARNERRVQPQAQSTDDGRRGHPDRGEAADAGPDGVADDRDDRSGDDRRGGGSDERDDHRSGERRGRAGGPEED